MNSTYNERTSKKGKSVNEWVREGGKARPRRLFFMKKGGNCRMDVLWSSIHSSIHPSIHPSIRPLFARTVTAATRLSCTLHSTPAQLDMPSQGVRSQHHSTYRWIVSVAGRQAEAGNVVRWDYGDLIQKQGFRRQVENIFVGGIY